MNRTIKFLAIALGICFVVGVVGMCAVGEQCIGGHREFSGEACK